MLSVFIAFGLFLSVLTSHSYAQAIVEKIDKCNFDLGVNYTEETIKTTVPFTVGFFSKREIQVEISGVLWMPCAKDHPKPYPLTIFNHGSQTGDASSLQPVRSGFGQTTSEFIEKGIALFIPMRKGFYRSGTQRPDFNPEDSEPRVCNNDGGKGIESASSDVKALYNILFSTRKEDLDFNNITMMGFSRGGFLSLALVADGFPGVTRIFNFVGGWSSEVTVSGGSSCDNGFLQEKFGEFGRKIKVPVFSFYGDRDWFSSERYSRSAVKRLEEGGAPSTYHLIPGGTHLLMYTHGHEWKPLVFKK